jgi:hypothetical protein
MKKVHFESQTTLTQLEATVRFSAYSSKSRHPAYGPPAICGVRTRRQIFIVRPRPSWPRPRPSPLTSADDRRLKNR